MNAQPIKKPLTRRGNKVIRNAYQNRTRRNDKNISNKYAVEADDGSDIHQDIDALSKAARMKIELILVAQSERTKLDFIFESTFLHDGQK